MVEIDLPLDSATLIYALDKSIPKPYPKQPEDLGTEEGRMRIAFELGRRDVVEGLLMRLEKIGRA